MFGEKLINRVMERQKEFGYKTVANGRNIRNTNSSRFKRWSKYKKNEVSHFPVAAFILYHSHFLLMH